MPQEQGEPEKLPPVLTGEQQLELELERLRLENALETKRVEEDRTISKLTLLGTAGLVVVLVVVSTVKTTVATSVTADLPIIILLLGGAVALRLVAILYSQVVATIFGGVTGYLLADKATGAGRRDERRQRP